MFCPLKGQRGGGQNLGDMTAKKSFFFIDALSYYKNP